jgi:ribosomal protein L11 methyltransferase
VGFDVDPVTGPCLAENQRLNPVPAENRVVFFVGTTEALPTERQYDVIICNMIRTEAWPLIPDLLSRLNPGGHLVVSGQRVEDQAVWRPWFTTQTGALVKEIGLDGWWGFIFRNPVGGH